MKRQLRPLVTYLTITSFAVLSTGCTSQTPSPPEIPPASTFVMDFGGFVPDESAGKRQVRFQEGESELPGTNWTLAAGTVAVWNLILTVTLGVPVGAFVESFNHEAERQDDDTWVWAYEVDVAGIMHSAELHAKAVGGDIQWDMFISKEGVFTDVHWFSGVSNLIGTEGTWTLNRDPDNVTPFLGIEWHRASSGESSDIKYTNIAADSPEQGGYIFYAFTDGEPLDASFEAYNKGQDNRTFIEWNRTTMEGRLQDALRFGDEDWRCWDSALQDVECATTAE